MAAMRKRILVAISTPLILVLAAAAAATFAWRELNSPLSIAAEGEWLHAMAARLVWPSDG